MTGKEEELKEEVMTGEEVKQAERANIFEGGSEGGGCEVEEREDEEEGKIFEG